MTGRYRQRRPWSVATLLLAALAALVMPTVRPDPVDAQASLSTQATLTVLSSPVDVQRASGNRDSAPSGSTLVVGDRIFTGSGGSAKLTFFQGTEVDIAPETELMVQEMTQRQSGATTVSFGQAVGSTVAKVTALLNPASRVQVSTQSAVAVVRGTELEITVTKDQVQIFKSTSGSFDVIAGGQTQRVRQGQVTVVPPPPPMPAPAGGRSAQSVGNNRVAIASGNDRVPMVPVPEAEIATLFKELQVITASDGPPLVVTPPPPPPSSLFGEAQGTPMPSPVWTVPTVAAEPTVLPATPIAPTPIPPTVIAATPMPSTPVPTTSGPAESQPQATAVTTGATPTATCVGWLPDRSPASNEAQVIGSVKDATGNAVGCVSVQVSPWYSSATVVPTPVAAMSDALGNFSATFAIPASVLASPDGYGPAFVSAWKAGYTQVDAQYVTMTAGTTVALASPIVLRTNDAVLSGTVTSLGTPISGAQVAMMPMMSTSGTSVDRVRASGQPVRARQMMWGPVWPPTALATTSPSGTYELALASGAYQMVRVMEGSDDLAVAPTNGYQFRATLQYPFTKGVGPEGLDVALPTLHLVQATCVAGGNCTVAVTGSGWVASIPATLVTFTTASGYASPMYGGGIAVDANGALDPTPLAFPSVWIGSGTFRIAVSQLEPRNSDTLWIDRTVMLGSTESLVVPIAPPPPAYGRILGNVVDTNGIGVVGATVKAADANYGMTLGATTTGAGGAFSLDTTAVSSGGYAIIAGMTGTLPETVPTVVDTPGMTMTLDPAIVLKAVDASYAVTISGPGYAPGASTVNAMLYQASAGSSYLGYAVPVETVPVTTTGTVVVPALSGTAYSWVAVTEAGTPGYAKREARGAVSVAAVGVPGTATVTFPSIAVTPMATCVVGSPCTLQVSGAGWDPNGAAWMEIMDGSGAIVKSLGTLGIDAISGDVTGTIMPFDTTGMVPGTAYHFVVATTPNNDRFRMASPAAPFLLGAALECTPVPVSAPTASEVQLTGRIVDGSGVAIGCASIEVTSTIDPAQANLAQVHAYGQATAAGLFAVNVPFPVGGPVGYVATFWVDAIKAGYTQLATPLVSGAAGQVVTITNPVVLKPASATLSGTVRDGTASGPGVVGASVAIFAPVDSAATAASLRTRATHLVRTRGLESQVPSVAAAFTTAGGAYSMPVAPGTYAIVQVAVSGNAGYIAQVITEGTLDGATGVVIGSGGVVRDYQLPTLSMVGVSACPSGTTACTITVSGDGWAPGQGVTVMLEVGSGNVVAFSPITPDANGHFANATAVVPGMSLSPGNYPIDAVQGIDQSSSRYVILGSASTYLVEAGVAGTDVRIRGTVLDDAGVPLVGASVVVQDYGYIGAVASGVTTGSGTFAIDLVAGSGAYLVTASVAGRTQVAIPVVSATAGSVVTLPSSVVLKANDATVLATVWRDATMSTPLAAGSTVAFTLQAPMPVGTPVGGGAWTTREVPVASSSLDNVGHASLAMPSGLVGAWKVADENSSAAGYRDMRRVATITAGASQFVMAMPTLDVVVTGTCGVVAGTCPVSVTGTGWAPNEYFYVGAYSTIGTMTDVATGTTSGSGVLDALGTIPDTGVLMVAGAQFTSAESRTVSLAPNYSGSSVSALTVRGSSAVAASRAAMMKALRPVATVMPTPTAVAKPIVTATPVASPTPTATPTPTSTPLPVATSTELPVATSTPAPVATTPVVTPVASTTLVALLTPGSTGTPTAVITVEPSVTPATVTPTATAVIPPP